jgi:hypothetical protein
MTRADIHKLFVFEFHQGTLPAPATVSDVRRVERELGTALPQSYLTFIQTHGSVRTPSLLSLIADGEHESGDLMVICEIAEVIKGTRGYWSAGMSDQLIGFASDSMGNLFCFRRVEPGSHRMDDAEVWFFDHEFCKVKKIADGFDAWLFSYLKLKRADLTA